MEVQSLSPDGWQHLTYPTRSMTTLLDHKKTLSYLAYLGFPGESTTAALKITQPRKSDRRKGKSSRNVFLCYVCGAAGSGKTSLLRLFAGKPYRDVYVPTSKPISVVNSVEIDGIEKYLVVRPLERPCSLPLLRRERGPDLMSPYALLCCYRCRSLDPIMKPRCYGIQNARTYPMLSYTFTTRATQTHSHTSVTVG